MRSPRHAAVFLALTGLVAAGLSAPAHAAPIFASSNSDGGSSYLDHSAVPCTVSDVVASPSATDVPVVENGTATTVSYSQSGRITRNSDPSDVIDFASNLTAKIQVKSFGGNPSTVTLDASGSVRSTATKPTSGCDVEFYSGADLEATFSVTNPGFFLYDYAASHFNYGEIFIERADNNDVDVWSEISAWKGSGRVFLDPGIYDLFLEADAWSNHTSATIAPTPVTVNLHLKYAKAGSALLSPKGKAKPYVKLPRSRSCASHDVQVKLKGKASKAKAVKLLVNGKTVKTIKNPQGDEKANLAVADGSDAAVVARVVLKPTQKGAKPVTVESSASYLACG